MPKKYTTPEQISYAQTYLNHCQTMSQMEAAKQLGFASPQTLEKWVKRHLKKTKTATKKTKTTRTTKTGTPELKPALASMKQALTFLEIAETGLKALRNSIETRL